MKITIATGPIFPVPTVKGGAVQRLWEGLAKEFAQRGHEVTIFAREFPGQEREETVDGIRYVRRGGYAQSASIKRDLVQCLLYALKVARHVPSGDIVVTNDFWLPVVLPWLNPSAGKVVPCLQRFPKNQCGLYGKCAALVAVSEAVADAVKSQSPSVAAKVAVVPNAVDGAFLQETKRTKDEEAKSAEHGAGSGEKEADRMRRTAGGRRSVRILYVGRIHPEKGLELLASALKLLAASDLGRKDKEMDWECVLVGPVAEQEGGGGEAFVAELRAMTDGLPVRIEAPVFDPASLVRIYNDADIFVYPSVAERGESFGIAPLEAMARGVVPVVSDLSVFREYIEPGTNGLVFDHRTSTAPAHLASAIESLLCDPGKRGAMGIEARRTAERYSLSATAERYLSLFAKIAAQPG